MKKNKFRKILLISFIFFLCFSFFTNTIFAEINQNYTQDGLKFEEGDSIIEKIMGFLTSLLLQLLAFAIYGLTWVVEKLVALVVGMLTHSSNIFPWADLSIFNGMAILDINFLNPAKGSMFMDINGDFTAIGTSIRNIYFTGLSIALGFLGIIVAIMAIRLAVSSIASEKAKYKEAIVHWITALVLIFGMHYILSFVFYLNEQLVEVASGLVQDILKDNSSKLSFLERDGAGIDTTSSVTLLGEYFKNESMDFGESNKFGVNSFTYALLYAIFVVQSLMIFWSYCKRFFYVLILSLISPFVVIYDFLVNSIS